ncbi:P-loop containing nucleoside triphosphate hydrolase protein [Suillus ampliporus]|nr:P-loop containing nucleoside triphosphate hydrolase protein [Suillus ampliporus]
MLWALAIRFGRRLMPLDKTVAASPLKRAYISQAAASVQKHHTTDDDHSRSPSPPQSSEQRPAKAPKLGGAHFTATPAMPVSSKGTQRNPTISPPFEMPSSSKSRGSLGSRISGSSSQKDSWRRGAGRGKGNSKEKPLKSTLDGPLRDATFIEQEHRRNIGSRPDIKPVLVDNPKSPVANFASHHLDKQPTYEAVEGIVLWVTVTLDTTPVVLGIGDHRVKRDAERLAALSALYQLHDTGLLDRAKPSASSSSAATQVIELSDGSVVNYERARNFMDYYCRRYGFGKPDIELEEQHQGRAKSTWEAVMTVGGSKIGMGSATNKKAAQIQCYLDVAQYLQQCDPNLWKTFVEASKTGKDLGLAPKVYFQISTQLEDEIHGLCRDIKKSTLYRNRPAIGSGLMGSDTARSETVPIPAPRPFYARRFPRDFLARRSEELKERRKVYLTDPAMEKMRNTRAALPIYTRSEELVSHIRENDVTICMAATGSGKTTQIPQLLLDDHIDRGEGARCNLICTQPRRLAALSVADRVAKERGEVVGEGSIGYSIRFESKLPEEHGSVTFCTTGVLLKKLQSAMAEGGLSAARMDEVTHIVVDEVHERDVDTDLLLVVLKRLMEDRKARDIPLKIVLMSATIDPSLFQEYFPDEQGAPAKVIEIPGRTYPVTKHFMEDFIPALKNHCALNWVFQDNLVSKYLAREEAYVQSCGRSMAASLPGDPRVPNSADEDLDLPCPLVAASISYVLQRSDSGHVLVFLPGWDEISAVQKILLGGSMDINFNDPSKYSIHLLHSTIPLAEQQVIFEPPPEGVRRIILATNIAETSITIPDVVYVVDAARIKEQRYDPDRHMSSLISAWVGSSNLNQRAGRAGRHRSGEYFGILSKARADNLHPHPTVEMKRVDLSNVVMHVKALSFPGMEIEEVLAAAIEPPEPDRVAAAMKNLQMVGALDQGKNLTSLGKVLLQLPVEVQMGRLVLYGSFFRCLDQALTLAAILTNRDPFVSPMHLKAQAAFAKNKWSPSGFRSDPLTILNAYNAWYEMQRRGEYMSANRFCGDNFLSKPTLLLITKIRGHLMQSLYQAGVIDVSAGGTVALTDSRSRELTVPPDLNVNGKSLPLLAALIAIASQPKYAVRTGEMTYRTQLDKATFIHPSSVNHRKHAVGSDQAMEKQIYAFAEKRQNLSMVGSSPQTYLITTTRLDPMTYMLFGAYEIQVTERGLECDGWLPIVGNVDVLDDIQRLKTVMESSMLRVFEGIVMARRKRRQTPISAREENETECEDEDTLNKDYSLSTTEIKELDLMTTDIVRILNRYSDERIASQSQSSSRTATPMASPSFSSPRLLPFEPRSGYSTPYGVGSSYNSRPGTPSYRDRLSSSRRY